MKKLQMSRSLWYASLLLFGVCLFSNCKDDYFEKYGATPEWLGASIYDWLANPTNQDGSKYNGTFDYYVRIIESIEDAGVNYKEVLQKTGSKTLFVADDAAFEAFFANNPYGISKFEDFSLAQLRAILFSNMLNDTYLIEMLSSAPAQPPVPGLSMRRVTSWSYLDTIPFEIGDQLPQNVYWERFREKGLRVWKDNSDYTMVSFLEPQMAAKGITNDDFYWITGEHRVARDAHIFNAKILRRDITCQNGYINLLDRLLLPVDNLAEHLRKNKDAQLFNSFIERYAVPVFAGTYMKDENGAFIMSDSIFVKRYFTDQTGHGFNVDPLTRQVLSNDELLKFDPGWNGYKAGSTDLTVDMAAMFVPSDEALRNYFNGDMGAFLKNRYGKGKPAGDLSWLSEIPNSVLGKLVNNHLRPSFVESTPSRFESLEDKMGTPMGVEPNDIKYATICSNGVAYIMDKVYPPSDYACVTAPVLVNENTRIIQKTITTERFDLYLLAMDKQRKIFSFFVPTDEALTNYISPVSIGKGRPERWEFYIHPTNNQLLARAFADNDGDGLLNDSVAAPMSAAVQNAMFDILDNHIVIGNVEDGKTFYQTKGGATIKITSGSGADIKNVQGGANIEQEQQIAITERLAMQNGQTYLVNNIVQPATRSVYQVMQDTPEFSEFFKLCLLVRDYPYTTSAGKDVLSAGPIFTNFPTNIGTTFNVAFFNTFNYSVYIPTNAAIQEAIAKGVIEVWDGDEDIPKYDPVWQERILKLWNFVRYHFQDNSIYMGGTPVNDKYETAVLNPATNKFRTLVVNADAGHITLKGEDGQEAHVITTGNNYNVMARDYKFNTPTINSATSIVTSSYAVLHQIDHVLNFETK